MLHIAGYLSFLLGSTNHHAVHSPFLFNYLTRCLYQGGWHYPSKAIGIALKSVPYFEIKSLGFLHEGQENEHILKQAFQGLRTDSPPFDLLISECPDALLARLSETNKPIFHNNTLCVIQNIHRNSRQKRGWDQINQQNPVRVTVDAFHCGLVFFRKELSRQDFKIRI